MLDERYERSDAKLMHLCRSLEAGNACHVAAEKSVTHLDIFSFRSNVWTEVMSSVVEQVRLAHAASLNRTLHGLVIHPIQVAPSLIPSTNARVDEAGNALDMAPYYIEHIRQNRNLKTLHLNRIEDYAPQPLLSTMIDSMLLAAASSNSLEEIIITRRPHLSPLCGGRKDCVLNVHDLLSNSKSLKGLSITTGSSSTFPLSSSKISLFMSKKPYYIVQGIGSGLKTNPHPSKLQHLSVSGGFVSDDELLEILAAANTIRTLSSMKIQLLSDSQIKMLCNDLLVLPHCPIKHLDLSGSIFSSDMSLATLLSGLMRNISVKTLVLENAFGIDWLGWRTDVSKKAWQDLALSNCKLERISLAHNKLEDDAVAFLLKTLGRSDISKLDLRGSSLDLCSCQAIQDESFDSCASGLETLSLGAISFSSTESMESFVKIFALFPSLKELDLGLVYCEEPNVCMHGFCILFEELKKLQNLEKISMTVLRPLSNASYVLERLVNSTSLKSLTIHGPLFQDDANDFCCLLHLLQKNPALEELDLSNSRSGSTPSMLCALTEGLRSNQTLRSLKLQNLSALMSPCWTYLWNNLFEVLTVNKTLEVLDLQQSVSPMIMVDRSAVHETKDVVSSLIYHLPKMRGLQKIIVNYGASDFILQANVALSFLNAVEQNYIIKEICGISLKDESLASRLEYLLLLNQAGRDRFLRGSTPSLPSALFHQKEDTVPSYKLSILFYLLRQGNILKECCKNIA